MIAEASAALIQLDADALEELARRAASLAAQVSALGATHAAPGLEAPRRLFAGIVQATGENLAVLRRAEAREMAERTGFGRAAFGLEQTQTAGWSTSGKGRA